jgi:hypothetical protein
VAEPFKFSSLFGPESSSDRLEHRDRPFHPNRALLHRSRLLKSRPPSEHTVVQKVVQSELPVKMENLSLWAMLSSEQMLFGEQTRSAIARDAFKEESTPEHRSESNDAGAKTGKLLTAPQWDDATQQSQDIKRVWYA